MGISHPVHVTVCVGEVLVEFGGLKLCQAKLLSDLLWYHRNKVQWAKFSLRPPYLFISGLNFD